MIFKTTINEYLNKDAKSISKRIEHKLFNIPIYSYLYQSESINLVKQFTADKDRNKTKGVGI